MQTLREFSTSQGFTGVIPTVKTNTNGYPYLVFVKGDTTECIYFSKTLAASLAAGQVLAKADFAEMRARLVTNATGEQRYKICSAGDSPVESVLDLF
jgi:lipopolysaccharide export system protein LptA